jgi:uncharacterized repeat protein (TIGR01451 family)
VAITSPAQAVITNDLTAYNVSVTNLGPDAAPNVILSNTLPPDVLLKGVSAKTYTTVGSNLIFNLGTLKNGGYTNIQFSIQPTNLEVLPLIASVGAAAVTDANLTNNSASTNLTVMSYLPGLLVAVTNSPQVINPQVGLFEQNILLSNNGTTSVPAARVVVTGLTVTNQLYNAVGTNNGNPFVEYSAPLETNQSVVLKLQFYEPYTRDTFPFSTNQLHADAIPLPDWTPPVVTVTSTNINIENIVELSNGNVLIQFPATLGKTYTVVYSDNVLFSNAMIAPPSFIATESPVQWIDYGPPTTTNAPANTPVRFYRVIQNP